MRLLDTETGRFVEVANTTGVRYAILSHTWDPQGEQTFAEVKEIQKSYGISRPYIPSPQELPPITRNRSHSFRSYRDVSLTSSISPISPVSPTSPLTGSDDDSTVDSFWDDPRLSSKIKQACSVARSHGYTLIWIDSCCIDKTSSSELSETINSMYRWYRDSHVCYAFLSDVVHGGNPLAQDSHFRRSRWFTRGWTLQELIAPRVVVFLSQEWVAFGTKATLATVIEEITGIDVVVLTLRRSLDKVSVATRMSWASERITTRDEDRAYSLLGIFDIKMPALYGEGARAFIRLQEEILKRIPDQSILASGSVSPSLFPLKSQVPKLTRQGHTSPHSSRFVRGGSSPRFGFQSFEPDAFSPITASSLLATSPTQFKSHHHACIPLSYGDFILRLGRPDMDIPIPEYTHSSYGIRTQLPLLRIADCFDTTLMESYDSSQTEWYLAILACRLSSPDGYVLARICSVHRSVSGLKFLQYGCVHASNLCSDDTLVNGTPRWHLFSFSQSDMEACRRHLRIETVYLPYDVPEESFLPVSLLAKDSYLFFGDTQHVTISLSSLAHAVLLGQGYRVDYRDPSQYKPCTYYLCLAKHRSYIHIELEFVQDEGFFGSFRVTAWVVDSPDDPEATAVGSSPWTTRRTVAWADGAGIPDIELKTAKGNDIVVSVTLDESLEPGYGSYQLGVEVSDLSLDDDPPSSTTEATALLATEGAGRREPAGSNDADRHAAIGVVMHKTLVCVVVGPQGQDNWGFGSPSASPRTFASPLVPNGPTLFVLFPLEQYHRCGFLHFDNPGDLNA
ncbi:hypothetical protein DICSQDRAFT_181632 [Dichomitus squalens LYAD-421 SS1]|uniref:Uncharacterized protein n=1 Tax=Dichomitus squalens (strain LYAD-421) TaxID=732165 RepID=R7SXY6_DICSQ|nr:uncharacterized protein DICSQDRAFT_181632 [Dichomitus squalens LYAD-421 SS1]EJF59842.1 hypothetical protein DICSQDRAFT_181632 [Dichomitus squalens LYAD-421 SS1]